MLCQNDPAVCLVGLYYVVYESQSLPFPQSVIFCICSVRFIVVTDLQKSESVKDCAFS